MKNISFFSKLLKISYLTVAFLIFVGVVLANDNNKQKSIRTLIVGGGSSHDFDKWYKQVDAETLEKDGLATVIYTDNTDSIIYYLPQIDVLFLSNNKPMNNPEARKAVFDFVKSGKGLILAHPALWYNWKDWPEYNLQLAGGGSNGHDQYGCFEVTVIDTKHPVTAGLTPKFSLKDERYIIFQMLHLLVLKFWQVPVLQDPIRFFHQYL